MGEELARPRQDDNRDEARDGGEVRGDQERVGDAVCGELTGEGSGRPAAIAEKTAMPIVPPIS